MTCEDTRKRLKAFLDDLLAESEYRDMCVHLGSCSACSNHVRSISSLGNQLWKMGKIRVPGDMSSTILYKYAHAGEHGNPAAPCPGMSKKQIYAALAAAAAAIALLIAAFAVRDKPVTAVIEEKPVIRTSVIRESKPPEADEEQEMVRTLERIAETLKENADTPEGSAAEQ